MEINTSFQPEFKSPDYTPAQISDLRLRLGQSRADFARAFDVALDIVFAWENGSRKPTAGQRSCMVRLWQNAEEYCEKTALRPALECALRERKIGQIHTDDVTLGS
jgi:transcriptional regulator with XRE-family HTH domain